MNVKALVIFIGVLTIVGLTVVITLRYAVPEKHPDEEVIKELEGTILKEREAHKVRENFLLVQHKADSLNVKLSNVLRQRDSAIHIHAIKDLKAKYAKYTDKELDSTMTARALMGDGTWKIINDSGINTPAPVWSTVNWLIGDSTWVKPDSIK